MSGCVTNFYDGERRLTIWQMSSGRFELSEYGAGGHVLPLTYDPIFQPIAAEIQRLANEVGRLRREIIERDRRERAGGER